MKTSNINPVPAAMDMDPATTDMFTTSLAPINRTHDITFGLLDRICCVSVFAMAMMFMRFLAK